jgi:hypothetical protein
MLPDQVHCVQCGCRNVVKFSGECGQDGKDGENKDWIEGSRTCTLNNCKCRTALSLARENTKHLHACFIRKFKCNTCKTEFVGHKYRPACPMFPGYWLFKQTNHVQTMWREWTCNVAVPVTVGASLCALLLYLHFRK